MQNGSGAVVCTGRQMPDGVVGSRCARWCVQERRMVNVARTLGQSQLLEGADAAAQMLRPALLPRHEQRAAILVIIKFIV